MTGQVGELLDEGGDDQPDLKKDQTVPGRQRTEHRTVIPPGVAL